MKKAIHMSLAQAWVHVSTGCFSAQAPPLNPLSPNDAIWRHTYFRQHNFMKKC